MVNSNTFNIYNVFKVLLTVHRDILEVKNWKRVALNRDEWTKLLKKARAHHGLSSQWWWWWWWWWCIVIYPYNTNQQVAEFTFNLFQ